MLNKRELVNKFANYIGGSGRHLVLSGLSDSRDKILKTVTLSGCKRLIKDNKSFPAGGMF